MHDAPCRNAEALSSAIPVCPPSRWNRTTLTLISYRFEACTPDHRGSTGRNVLESPPYICHSTVRLFIRESEGVLARIGNRMPYRKGSLRFGVVPLNRHHHRLTHQPLGLGGLAEPANCAASALCVPRTGPQPPAASDGLPTPRAGSGVHDACMRGAAPEHTARPVHGQG